MTTWLTQIHSVQVNPEPINYPHWVVYVLVGVSILVLAILAASGRRK